MALKDVSETFWPDDDEVLVAVAQFFREIGFEADEMSFEDKFVIMLDHTSLNLVVAPKEKRNKLRQCT